MLCLLIVSAAIKVNNWKKHSTDISSSSKSAKNIFTKDVQKHFVAGMASAIGVHRSAIDIIDTKDHYSSVTEQHGMIIKKYGSSVQLGSPPFLMKVSVPLSLPFRGDLLQPHQQGGSSNIMASYQDCADECLLFEKCKFGTFIKSGNVGAYYMATVFHEAVIIRLCLRFSAR